MANLPEDILKLVFKSFAEDELYRYKFWAEQLVLLSVCQRWRQCALPLVCHYAGFEFVNPKDKNMDFESMDDGLVTNFNKVMAIGHPSFVRHLAIHVNSCDHIFACIKLVLNMMGGHLPVWNSLHAISIYSTITVLDDDSTVEEASFLSCTSKAMVDKIAKMMPNIVMLQFHDIFINNIFKIFYGQLADLYAPYLNTLVAHKPIPLDDINTFSRLANLEVECQNNPHIILPLVHIDILECLTLRDVPESLQWYNCARNQSNKFVFSNLRKLELRYIVSSDSSTMRGKTVDTPELHFPKLESLIIFEPSKHQLLLSCSVFNFELDLLVMSADTISLKQLACIKLPSIKRLALFTTLTDHESLASAFDVLCNVAKVRQVIDDMRLTITDEAQIDLTGCGVYPPLTSLEIHHITNYEQIFSLVQRLPLLKELILQTINRDDITNDKLKTLLGNQHGIAPISSSVDRVSIIHGGIFRASQTTINFTTLLLVGLPALRELYAWRIDQRILFKIINKLKARYPHLENVRVLSP